MLPLLFLLASVLLSGAAGGEIYWGNEAKPHSRPYMALVRSYDDRDCQNSQCGGFLVGKNFVMTAAHCFGRNMTVTLGAHNIRKRENSQQVIPVLRAFPHQDYDAQTLVNDIMLLKLKKKAKLTKEVQPIALPGDGDSVRPGKVCSVAAWGRMEGGKSSDTLREVDLEVQDEKQCKKHFKTNYNNDTQLCVGKPNSKKAAGSGDSGGPLLCDRVAQGIVCYACKDPNVLPQVFTRISSFITWIHKTMRRSWGNETSASRSQSPSHVWGLLSDSQ